MKNKQGMTLLEMLVVIGIIGILAAVLLSQFGGATESAKAAQCMNNMRSLAVGVINAATAHNYGHYPPALSFKHKPTVNDAGDIVHYIEKGWISWTKSGENILNKDSGEPNYSGEANLDTLMFALTNGAVWSASGRSRAAYLCPVHAQMFKDKNGREPGWSFAMNQEFGYSSRKRCQTMGNNITVTLDSKRETARSPDKVLLFAEMPGISIESVQEPDYSGTSARSDSVLEYSNESIGFNHKISGGKYMGHVAFTDGHVEKLILPSSGNVKDLTKWLCQGYDISFDGRQYTRATDQ